MGEPETVLTWTFSMEVLVLMVSVKKRWRDINIKEKKKITGRQKSYLSGDNMRDRREIFVTVCPSVPARGVEGGQWLHRHRLKTLLSYTVIPPHKSVLSHPLCTDKAAKHRLILGRSGETFFFAFMNRLSRSRTPFSYLCYLFFIHQPWTADKLFFFYALELLVRSLPYFLSNVFPVSPLYWWTSESFANRKKYCSLLK